MAMWQQLHTICLKPLYCNDIINLTEITNASFTLVSFQNMTNKHVFGAPTLVLFKEIIITLIIELFLLSMF